MLQATLGGAQQKGQQNCVSLEELTLMGIGEINTWATMHKGVCRPWCPDMMS